MALMVLGAVAAVIGILGDHTDHHQRTWASLLRERLSSSSASPWAPCSSIALQNATETAWSVMVKRVYRRHLGFLPIGAVLVVLLCRAGMCNLYLDGPHACTMVHGGGS
jgi:hypothetical protein